MSRKTNLTLCIILLSAAFSISACIGGEQERSQDDDIQQCTVIDNLDGSFTMKCPDGSTADFKSGKDGEDGKEGQDGQNAPEVCILKDSTNGIHTLVCDGEQIVIGDNCPGGYPGSIRIGGDGYGDNSGLAILTLFKCTTIQGDLHIEMDYKDESFFLDPVLSGITEVGGSLSFYGQYESTITSITLPNLASIGENLTVDYAANIEEISFDALTTIGGTLALNSLQNITDISFASLESVGDNIEIFNLENLTRLSLDTITSVGNNITVVQTEMLESLSFASLESIEGSLNLGIESYEPGHYYELNESLTTPSFPALKTINKDLVIISNPELLTLEGLSALETIGQNLIIENNPKLTSTIELSALESITENIAIRDNASLDVCETLLHLQTLPGFDVAPNTTKFTIAPFTDSSCI